MLQQLDDRFATEKNKIADMLQRLQEGLKVHVSEVADCLQLDSDASCTLDGPRLMSFAEKDQWPTKMCM